MKVKTLLVTVFTLLGLTLILNAGLHHSTNNALAAETFSLQSLACESATHYMTMSVMMPDSFVGEQLEIESKRVCDSIDEHTKTANPTAVCDTDTNCDYWDYYRNYGVARIFVSHDEGKTRWLAVTCEGDTKEDEPMIIDDPSEMEVICQNSPKPVYTDKNVKGYRWNATLRFIGEYIEKPTHTLIRTPNMDVLFPKGTLDENVAAILIMNLKLTHTHDLALVEEESIMQVESISVQTKDGVVQAYNWFWTNKDEEYSSDPH